MQGNYNEKALPIYGMTGFYVGWRRWIPEAENIKNQRLHLKSITSYTNWKPLVPMTAQEPLHSSIFGRVVIREIKGQCRTHKVLKEPKENLGVFAMRMKTFDNALTVRGFHSKLVIGLVALWGEVIVHENGLRSSFAYPLCLSDSKLAEVYKVPYAYDNEKWPEVLESMEGSNEFKF